MNEVTEPGGLIVTFLVGGTLAVLVFTMLFDFFRGLARG